jgi:hypothetical protein
MRYRRVKISLDMSRGTAGLCSNKDWSGGLIDVVRQTPTSRSPSTWQGWQHQKKLCKSTVILLITIFSVFICGNLGIVQWSIRITVHTRSYGRGIQHCHQVSEIWHHFFERAFCVCAFPANRGLDVKCLDSCCYIKSLKLTLCNNEWPRDKSNTD